MARLRVSLTLPGAVSLGAYEGGALAAFVVAAKVLGEETLVVDSIASASAGSITALLTARALLRGADPIELFTRAWVEKAAFSAMKTHSTDAPLSSTALSAMATDVLGPSGVADGDPTAWQREPVRLSMALTNLAGLTYALPVLARRTTVEASTYLDFYDATLTSAEGAGTYVELAEAALASGSNAIGFPPKLLDRSASRAEYERAGLRGFPDDGLFWCSDGGTVDNEPIGRTIDVAASVGSDDDRVYVLLHPNPPTSATGPSPWSGDAPQPSWVRAGTHAFSVSRSQSVYEDLKRLEKTNSHLVWSESIATAVRSGVEGALQEIGLPPDQAERVRARLAAEIGSALAGIREQQASVEALAARAPRERAADAGDYAALLSLLVHASTGLEGKDVTTVEVVSPVIDPAVTEPPSAQLAGAFFFHFGGFFDVKYRQSDFALGYRNMSYWLQNCLAAYLPGVDLQAALKEVDRRYQALGWDHIRLGGSQFGSLSLLEKAEVIELAAHVARVVAHDLHGGDGAPSSDA